MKLPHLTSGKVVSVNISDYKIDWDKSVSKPQKAACDFLRPYWQYDCILQELRIPGSLLRIDIINVNKMIALEVSPKSVHNEFNKFMHKDRMGFLKKLKADEKKRGWAERAGFQFIELVDEDVKNLSKELFRDKFGIEL